MNHPKAIMIDVDDTMVEWSETLSLAWRRACDRLADIVPGLDALLLEAMVVCNRKSAPELSQEDALSTALTNLGIATPPEMISVLDRFHQDRIDTVRPIRGAARAIRKIRTKVERLGVVTNMTTFSVRSYDNLGSRMFSMWSSLPARRATRKVRKRYTTSHSNNSTLLRETPGWSAIASIKMWLYHRHWE
jgi:FMN phosphatase YigB (HAD superfamily)